jgi:hypothetical protein
MWHLFLKAITIYFSVSIPFCVLAVVVGYRFRTPEILESQELQPELVLDEELSVTTVPSSVPEINRDDQNLHPRAYV